MIVSSESGFRKRSATVLLVSLAAFLQVSFAMYTFRALSSREPVASLPFRIDDTRTVTQCGGQCVAAGVRDGDRVVAVNGETLSSPAVLKRHLLHLEGSPSLSLQVERAHEVVQVSVPPVLSTLHLSLKDWLLPALLFVLAPGMALLLGTGVVLARRDDPRAYLLLLLTASFSQIFHSTFDANLLPIWLSVYRQLAVSALGLWLVAFSLYFPEQFGMDRRHPFRKWILLGPFAYIALTGALKTALTESSYGHLASLSWLLRLPDAVRSYTVLAGLILFLSLLSFRAFRSPSQDSRWRSGFLACGTVVALLPIILQNIAVGTSGHTELGAFLANWQVAVMLCTYLFPCCLVYVVVVRRSTEGNSLLHLSAQYDLAKGLVRLAATVILIFAFLANILIMQSGLMKGHRISAALGIAAVAILLQVLLVDALEEPIQRYFRRSKADAEGFVQSLSMTGSNSPAEILDALTDALHNRLCASWIIAFLPVRNALRLTSQAGRVPEFPEGTFDDWHPHIPGAHSRLLSPRQTAQMFAEVPAEKRRQVLSSGAHLTAVIATDQSLEAILIFGPKPAEKSYQAADFRFLRSTCNSVALLLRNAGLVEQLSKEIQAKERKTAEKIAAEEASRAKSDFMARMSHELRTPLNAIIGYSELLQEQEEDSGHLDISLDLEKIKLAGKHLLSLINAVLDISKIEAGKLELYLEPIRVEELIRNVALLSESLVSKNGNTLEMLIDPGLGIALWDAVKVRQILFNLLSNAAKFTTQGQISVVAEKHSPDEIRITVSDRGIGMTEAQLERIFEPFTQADESIASRYGGTGLGLSISRIFAELHNGRLYVLKTAPGEGTTFCLEMPERQANPVEPVGVEIAVTDRPRILIVEDNEAASEILQRVAGSHGWDTSVARDTQQAIDLLSAFRPDLVTLDVYLADGESWKLLTTLRERPETAATPVVMVTVSDHRSMAFALGATDYVMKPVEPALVGQVLTRRLARTKGMEILLVDDDEAGRLRLASSLQQEYLCQITHARDGREALQRLQERKPDMMITDLMMPEMDGFTLLSELRSHEDFHDLPVLVLTSKDLTSEERRTLAACAARVLEKSGNDLEETFSQELRNVSILQRRQL